MHRTVVEIPGDRGGIEGVGVARFDASVLGGVLREGGGDAIATWSGSYAQIRGGELFGDDFATWGPRGWDAIEEAMKGFSGRVVIRTHARHVISDPIGCLRLLRQPWATACTLMYDPGSMLTDSMRGVDQVNDHLRRMYEEIGRIPDGRLAAVVRPRIEGVSEGFVLELESRHVPAAIPVLMDRQR